MSNKDFNQRSKIKFPHNNERAEMQSIVDKLLKNRNDLEILEAGCGSANHVKFRGNINWTGIDLSKEQLAENNYLKNKILGDIQSYNFKKSYYDIIVCWNVLEHVQFPEKALNNFLKAIRKEGLIILAMPNVCSVKGLVTKYSPHWFHIFVYKYIYKIEKAGLPGYLPFKTFLKLSISPKAIKIFAERNNLSIEYMKIYESYVQKGIKNNIFIKLAINFSSIILKIFTFGKLGTKKSDIIAILKK